MAANRFHCVASVLAFLTAQFLNFDMARAASAPTSVAQVALYQGADREKILIEGAKKEGAFTLYGSHTWYRTMTKEFEKKYPFFKVTEYRTDGRTLIKRAIEESKAGQYIADVIATTGEQMDVMKREGIFLEHWTSDARVYPDDVKDQRQERILLCRTLRDLRQLGFQHVCNSAGRGAEVDDRSVESKMERQDVDRQHDDGYAMDRQHAGSVRARIPGENRRARGESAKYGGSSSGAAWSFPVKCRCHRRSSTPTLRRPNKRARRWSGGPLEPVVTTVAYSGIGLKRRIPMRRCCSSTGCIPKKASK